MSGSKIRLYGSTSGYVELEAPAVAPDGVLTLPTGTGGFGKTLQVVQTVKTDIFTTTSTSYVDVTGLSVTITPSSATSKLLVMASVTFSTPAVSGAQAALVRLYDGTNSSPVGDLQGSRLQGSLTNSRGDLTDGVIHWLYTPGVTSAVTVAVQAQRPGTGGTWVLNGAVNNTDNNTIAAGVSTLTAIEVAA